MSEIADAVPAALEALAAGGDVFSVELAAGGAKGPAKVERHVADSIAPDGGETRAALLPPQRHGGALALSYAARGRTIAAALVPVAVDPRWLAPFVTVPPIEARALLGPATAALIEPVVRPAPAAPVPEPRGFMERSVVRDALSLAFTPRARACYLNRTGATPAERDLTGRVRLALDLVRGEVGAARIESSTLGHPTIESCLREAAFGLIVPRAYRNDEPVTAVLNLVFRPRTPERAATSGGDPEIDRRLDVLIEVALRSDSAAPESARGVTTPAPPAPPFLPPTR